MNIIFELVYSPIMLWWVLIMCNINIGDATQTACDTEQNPEFYRLEKSADMYKFDPYQALHIEDDLDDSTIRLLVSTAGRIWNYHIETKEMEQLFGQPQHGFLPHPFTSALFNIISGFRQINKTALLVADKNNHCIRLLNRYTGTTNYTIGICERSGNQDGVKSEALFHRPTKIIDGQYKHEYLIADAGNRAIRSYNMFTTSVGTIAHNIHMSSKQDMVLHENRTLLYVAVKGGIALIDLLSPAKSPRVLLYQPTPYGIVQIPLTELFLNTHDEEDKLTIMDDSVSRLQTVCDETTGSDLISCHVDDPSSISYSYHLNAFIISTKHFIKLLNVSYRDASSAQCRLERQTITTQEATTTTTSEYGLSTTEPGRHIPSGDGLDYGYMPYIAAATAVLSLMIAIIFALIAKTMKARKQTVVRESVNQQLLSVKHDCNSAAESTIYEEVCYCEADSTSDLHIDKSRQPTNQAGNLTTRILSPEIKLINRTSPTHT